MSAWHRTLDELVRTAPDLRANSKAKPLPVKVRGFTLWLARDVRDSATTWHLAAMGDGPDARLREILAHIGAPDPMDACAKHAQEKRRVRCAEWTT